MDLRDAERLAIKLMAQHGLCADPAWDFSKRVGWAGSNPKPWTFKWDNAYRRFGVCKHYTRQIGMSKKLVAINNETEVRDTILHEIAHALVAANHQHDEVWKAKAREIGAKPVACYSNDDTACIVPKWVGFCPTCRKEFTRWRAPKSWAWYSCKACSTGRPFGDRACTIKYSRIDIVKQPTGTARTAKPVTPPLPGILNTWYLGQYMPVDLATALKEENMALNEKQIEVVKQIAQQRNIAYKMAVQYFRRHPELDPTPAFTPSAPLAVGDQVQQPTGEVLPVVSAGPEPTPAPVVEPPAPVQDVVVPTVLAAPKPVKLPEAEAMALAVALHAQGTRPTDIAVRLGFERGNGTGYVKKLLVKAGVRQ